MPAPSSPAVSQVQVGEVGRADDCPRHPAGGGVCSLPGFAEALPRLPSRGRRG